MVASSSVREERTTRTRSDIVEAAMSLFIGSGFDATTIDEIARRSGIGRRTFFRYFPTKEAVLFSEFKARQAYALESLERSPADESSLSALVRVLGDMCDHPLEPARAARIRRVVHASPILRDRQRLVVVDGFGHDLVTILAARDDTLTELQLRVLVASVLECNTVATMDYLLGADRPVREMFDEAVEGCRAAWSTLPA
jgi:AcrR family transcriptional regulator